MSTYKNGQIPSSILVRRGNFLLTAGTWAKWDALVADVERRFNVTLRITDGVGVMKGTGAYRDLLFQRAVKAYYTSIGRWWQAAAAGTSSHGGEFHGEDALAVDVNNYGQIPRAEFYAAARRAGFQANYFDGANGKPKEPWHLIDRDPYRVVGSTAGLEEGDIMTEDEKNELIADIKWLKDRIGGSASTPSLTDRLRGVGNGLAAIGAVVDWMKARVGGSTKTAPSITDELRGLRDVDADTGDAA
jgi:hypothetical protein